jgi:PAS domain S-box-containing protein
VEDKIEAFDAGGVDYILKPFHPTEVLARVHTHLSLSKMQKQLEQMVGHRTAQLETSNRALRMLSNTNQLLVRAQQREEFVQKVCESIVTIGQFSICYVDLTQGDVNHLIASYGAHKNAVDQDINAFCRIEKEQCLFESVRASQNTRIIQNIKGETPQTPWHQMALDKGYQSAIGLPLVRKNQTIGLLAILADQPDVFNETEVNLLRELVEDLSFGIHILEERAKRRRAEIALTESELRYRMLFEKAGDAILIMQVEPDRGLILQANQAAASMHGYGVEELIGKHITELDSPEDAKKSEGRFARLFKGEWLNMEMVHLKKDGTSFPVEISAGQFKVGDQNFVLSFIRDITVRKKMENDKKVLEEQIRQANKMEAIGTLASGIAHDFNNILFAISGFTELSIEFTPEDSIVKNNLLKVQHANQRAAELVSQILTLSRKKEHSLQPLQPKLIIKEALKLLRATLPSTIDIITDIQSDAYIQADATQIHQIMMNLCVNANHAMEDTGGALTIQLVERVLDESEVQHTVDLEPGVYVELSVTDTGKGIPENIRDKVFDPYFTTKPQEMGTGLGLAVVHGIVKSYLGDISIESEEGHGCKVTILLPVIDNSPKKDPVVETPLPKGNESILFVDDEEILIDIGRQMLEVLGYNVTTCENGPEALELYKKTPDDFDLVITDYTMPKLTGPQLARAIREITPDQPIVMVSGREAPLTDEESRDLGITSFIRKPVILKEIAEAVRSALDKDN